MVYAKISLSETDTGVQDGTHYSTTLLVSANVKRKYNSGVFGSFLGNILLAFCSF